MFACYEIVWPVSLYPQPLLHRFAGDVCTHPEYQRQGAAGQIITGILREFEEERVSRGGRIVAALHAMESMRPFYAKYGFKSVNAQRSLLSIPWPGRYFGSCVLCLCNT